MTALADRAAVLAAMNKDALILLLIAREKEISDHNAECASACGDGELEGVGCGYRPYFPRHCPECPRNWMIDSALAQHAPKKEMQR